MKIKNLFAWNIVDKKIDEDIMLLRLKRNRKLKKILTWTATLKPLPEKYGCAYVVDDNGLKNDVSRLCDIIIARCKENEKNIARP